MKRFFVLVLWLKCLWVVAAPEAMNGKVIAVIDGNTIQFLTSDNESFKFVLAGVDAPELNQEFGDAAKKFLEKLLQDEAVIITIEGKDRLGNRVGSLTYKKDKDPRLELLENGLAWTAEKNPKPEFETLKEAAKSKEKGLWAQSSPTPPWIFRRQQTMLTAKSS